MTQFGKRWLQGIAALYQFIGMSQRAKAYSEIMIREYIKSSDYEGALKALGKLPVSDSPNLLMLQGYCHGMLNQNSAGVKCYKQALLLAGATCGPELLNNLAWNQERLDNFAQAERNYYRGLALAPEDPSLLQNLVMCLKKQKKYMEALNVIEDMKNLSDRRRLYWSLKAQIYEDLGEESKAVEYYNKALGLE